MCADYLQQVKGNPVNLQRMPILYQCFNSKYNGKRYASGDKLEILLDPSLPITAERKGNVVHRTSIRTKPERRYHDGQ